MSADHGHRLLRRRAVIGAAWCGATAAAVGRLSAQQGFPARHVSIVVGFPPGTATDALTRILAARMTQDLGQPVLVDNRPGGGGSVGAASVARAKPDGYTLLVGASAPLAINPHVYPSLPYDALSDFAGLGLFTWLPFVLVSRPSLPAQNLAQLLALARARPGDISYGSSGNGTTSHLLMEIIGARAGVRFKHVPYKGSAQAQADIVGGQIDCSFDSIVSCVALVRSGRLNALAVSTAERVPAMPLVATVAEQGYPGFDAGAWLGLVAPVATPAPILDRLEQSLQVALQDAGFRDKLTQTGAEPRRSGSRAGFDRFIRKEHESWGQIVRQFNVGLN